MDLSPLNARAKSRSYQLKRPEPLEADIQSAILRALRVHPAVAMFWRQNTGAMAVGEGKSRRFIRFGPKGQSDIQGYLKDGRALFIECKSRTGRLTHEQREFLEMASKHGAIAFVARSVADVFQVLDGVLRGHDGAEKETDAVIG